MEFPDVGERCSWSSCGALDFLPFTCPYCNQIFCKDHFNQDLHKCQFPKQEISKSNVTQTFICSHDNCSANSPTEMICEKCQNHFCLAHRFHGCHQNFDNIEEKQKVWNEPREQFAKSVKIVNTTIDEKIKNAIQDSKKKATALKIQLMRLKQKAEGAATIPTVDRIYFLILLPKGSKISSKPIFVSKDWSVGKTIDAAASLCNIINKNNELHSPKLRLFKLTNGNQISSDTSVKIDELITKDIIVNGDSLILEFVDPNKDLSNFVLPNFSEYNNVL